MAATQHSAVTHRLALPGSRTERHKAAAQQPVGPHATTHSKADHAPMPKPVCCNNGPVLQYIRYRPTCSRTPQLNTLHPPRSIHSTPTGDMGHILSPSCSGYNTTRECTGSNCCLLIRNPAGPQWAAPFFKQALSLDTHATQRHLHTHAMSNVNPLLHPQQQQEEQQALHGSHHAHAPLRAGT